MNQIANFYCRFEDLHFTSSSPEIELIEEDSIFLDDIISVSYFRDIPSLKSHVLNMTKIWIERAERKNSKLLVMESNNNFGYKKISNWATLNYPRFMIYNRWMNWSIIGFCDRGWHVGSNNFEQYMMHYAVDIHGISKYAEVLASIPARNFNFVMGELTEESEINLLTDELVDLELEHFLDGKEITEEIRQEVYYSEMVRRGYLDIIGKKE